MGIFWFLTRRGRQHHAVEVALRHDPEAAGERLTALLARIAAERRHNAGWFRVLDTALSARLDVLSGPPTDELLSFLELLDTAPGQRDDSASGIDAARHYLRLAEKAPPQSEPSPLRLLRDGWEARRASEDSRRACVRAMVERASARPRGSRDPIVLTTCLELVTRVPSPDEEPQVHEYLQDTLAVRWDDDPDRCRELRGDLLRAREALPGQAWPELYLGIASFVADDDPAAALEHLRSAARKSSPPAELGPSLVAAAISAARCDLLSDALAGLARNVDLYDADEFEALVAVVRWVFAPDGLGDRPEPAVMTTARSSDILIDLGGPAADCAELFRCCLRVRTDDVLWSRSQLVGLLERPWAPWTALVALAHSLSANGEWRQLLADAAFANRDGLPAPVLARLAEAEARVRGTAAIGDVAHLSANEEAALRALIDLEQAILTGATEIPAAPADDAACSPQVRAELARARLRSALALGDPASARQALADPCLDWLPEAELRHLRALVSLLEGDPSAAVAHLEGAAALAPDNPLTVAARAVAASHAGAAPEEIEALSAPHDHPACLLASAHAALLAGDDRRSREILAGVPDQPLWDAAREIADAALLWHHGMTTPVASGMPPPPRGRRGHPRRARSRGTPAPAPWRESAGSLATDGRRPLLGLARHDAGDHRRDSRASL